MNKATWKKAESAIAKAVGLARRTSATAEGHGADVVTASFVHEVKAESGARRSGMGHGFIVRALAQAEEYDRLAQEGGAGKRLPVVHLVKLPGRGGRHESAVVLTVMRFATFQELRETQPGELPSRLLDVAGGGSEV